MTVEKVLVTKEVAGAIEYLRKNFGYKFSDFMKDKTQGGWTTIVEASPLNYESIETLAKALINGYEIEKSPEEKVREYYESYGGSPSALERKGGIIWTLNLLGIKIEGVND